LKHTKDLLNEQYRTILTRYLQNKSEQGLYQAEQLSKQLLEQKVSPEELVSLHRTVLSDLFPSLSKDVQDSFEFLLEVMVGYGLAYREHQSLRDRQQELESEIDVAANMQQTLLPKEKLNVPSLDIGIISVPAEKMSGDFYHYIQYENDCIGFAIADIIGKGVPAALCMSMIKYGMDSLPEQRLQPAALLENLNKVVEQNIGDSMFITMMYGYYDARAHQFHYSSAGHEPGFYYRAATDTFEDLKAKGLVLGVSRKAVFHEYKRDVNLDDFIVFLSDGVTECRVGDEFIERDEVVSYLRKYKQLPAQDMVEKVYQELAQIQGYNLRDDFTLMIVRRKV
jgi:sigma-B regulation protein RsbU (phosphoserine phosphatase)